MINWKLKNRNYRPIGLDFGHKFIKMIQLQTTGQDISVLDAAQIRIDPNLNSDLEKRKEFIVSSIRKIREKGNFKGNEVISSMPNDNLKITSLRLGQSEMERIEDILRKEVIDRFDINPEKDSINYMLAGNVRHGDELKNEYILFASKDEIIRNHINMLEKAELRPVGIDPVPCALYRSFSHLLRREEDKEQTEVFIDIGAWSSTVVFGRGGDISFIKNIHAGTENFNREIAKRLGIDIDEAEILRRKLWSTNYKRLSTEHNEEFSNPENITIDEEELDVSTRQIIVDAISSVSEELAKELSLCFRYYTVTFRGKRVEKATFTGGGAYENILLNVLRRQMAFSIEVAEPFNGIDIAKVNFDSDRRGLLCEWAVAIGLGLKGWRAAERIKEQGQNERNSLP